MSPGQMMVSPAQVRTVGQGVFQSLPGGAGDGDETTASVHADFRSGWRSKRCEGDRTVQEIAARHEIHPRRVAFGAESAHLR